MWSAFMPLPMFMPAVARGFFALPPLEAMACGLPVITSVK